MTNKMASQSETEATGTIAALELLLLALLGGHFLPLATTSCVGFCSMTVSSFPSTISADPKQTSFLLSHLLTHLHHVLLLFLLQMVFIQALECPATDLRGKLNAWTGYGSSLVTLQLLTQASHLLEAILEG